MSCIALSRPRHAASLIAAAVGLALMGPGLASAETTLYGSVRVGVQYTDDDTTDVNAWDVVNEASRLGVRGSEDLGGGLSAIYQYEFGVNADGKADGSPFNQRLSWVGLKGGFGSVTAGRQYSPYYNAVGIDDVWNGDMTGTSFGLVGSPTRISNALIYTSPSFSGLSFAGAITMDGAGNDLNDPLKKSDGIDLYDLAVSYKNGPLVLGAAYRGMESNGGGESFNSRYFSDGSLWGLAASYKFGDVFNLIGSYQDATFSDDLDSKAKAYGVTGELFFGNNVLRGGWGRYDVDNGDDYDVWRAGYQYNLSKRTRVWLEYIDSDFASGATSPFVSTGDEYKNIQFGMRHDF
ncbi:putative porin [Plasticicumulans lactativorans]|uniref:Putative porin n=1 Tax=Plasticicumulans lactativorans TaxID=1133106 RepID=A0A4R2KWV0_9GAMM|nr:porin [Plasticicumulans lactativorans]TCO75759.1 putative porin [Plasticicumulans lactativorans]